MHYAVASSLGQSFGISLANFLPSDTQIYVKLCRMYSGVKNNSEKKRIQGVTKSRMSEVKHVTWNNGHMNSLLYLTSLLQFYKS